MSDEGRPTETKLDNKVYFEPEGPVRCPDRPVWAASSFRKIEENRNHEVTISARRSTRSYTTFFYNTPLKSSVYALYNGVLGKSGFAEPDFWRIFEVGTFVSSARAGTTPK